MNRLGRWHILDRYAMDNQPQDNPHGVSFACYLCGLEPTPSAGSLLGCARPCFCTRLTSDWLPSDQQEYRREEPWTVGAQLLSSATRERLRFEPRQRSVPSLLCDLLTTLLEAPMPGRQSSARRNLSRSETPTPASPYQTSIAHLSTPTPLGVSLDHGLFWHRLLIDRGTSTSVSNFKPQIHIDYQTHLFVPIPILSSLLFSIHTSGIILVFIPFS